MGKRKKVLFLEEPPDFFEKDGLFHIRFTDIVEFAMSPAKFLETHLAAADLMAEWHIGQARKKVAPLVRKKR